MNDSNDPLNDEAIDKLLAPLRSVECPEEVRRANRLAIEEACARRARAPWWRRTVAVPIPLALAASLALVVTTAASTWPAIDSGARQSPQSSVVETAAPTHGWSVTRSYILSIESLARMQNSFHPDELENQDDT